MKAIIPDWPAPASVHALTTTRHIWIGKDGAEDEELIRTFNPPSKPVWLQQNHGIQVVEATDANFHSSADAAYAFAPKKVCAVVTADCLPLLICDSKGSSVAAIHAGWRGLSAGIIEAALDKLALSSDETLVWLGPAIGPQKFEVGKDVFDAFTRQHIESIAGFTPHTENKWLANLYELAKIRLNLRGITKIYGGGYCTYTQENLFFSYRRDHGKTGRMASLIWLD